jgi:hypothetical protein
VRRKAHKLGKKVKNPKILAAYSLDFRIQYPPFRPNLSSSSKLSFHSRKSLALTLIFVSFDDNHEDLSEPNSFAQSSLLCDFPPFPHHGYRSRRNRQLQTIYMVSNRR